MPIFALSCKRRAANCLSLMQRVAFLSQCGGSCPITALYESVPNAGRYPANQCFPHVKGWYVVVHMAWQCLIALVSKYTTYSKNNNSSFKKNQKCLSNYSQSVEQNVEQNIIFPPPFYTVFYYTSNTFDTLNLKANLNHNSCDVTSKIP